MGSAASRGSWQGHRRLQLLHGLALSPLCHWTQAQRRAGTTQNVISHAHLLGEPDQHIYDVLLLPFTAF